MTTFLFWNLKKLPREELVARVVREHEVDVVILAECVASDEEILRQLFALTEIQYRKPWSESPKLQIFTRLPELTIQPVFDEPSGRLTVRNLQLESNDVLLAAVHLTAKVNWTDEEQRAELQQLTRDIERIESERGHRRTIVVGDFNMNPFEKGMISSHGMHAVMTRQIASQGSRTVLGRDYPFFYNPMWGFFGDRTPGPPGTHYFRRSTPDMFFWNMFDQVLIRPELIPFFSDEIEILSTIETNKLTKANGTPDESVGSDHFPILFRLSNESATKAGT